jgi:uncharacterized protein (DUF2236 family)
MTYVPVYEEVFGKFSDEEMEIVLQEFSIMGTSLQVPLSMWPKSVADAKAYEAHIVNNVLEMTEPCKKTTNELQNAAKFVPWYLKPLMYVAGPARWNATTERLPQRVRDMYGLESTSWSRGLDYAGMTYLTWTYPYMPDAVRRFTVKLYMNKAQHLMEKGRLA